MLRILGKTSLVFRVVSRKIFCIFFAEREIQFKFRLLLFLFSFRESTLVENVRFLKLPTVLTWQDVIQTNKQCNLPVVKGRKKFFILFFGTAEKTKTIEKERPKRYLFFSEERGNSESIYRCKSAKRARNKKAEKGSRAKNVSVSRFLPRFLVRPDFALSKLRYFCFSKAVKMVPSFSRRYRAARLLLLQVNQLLNDAAVKNFPSLPVIRRWL